MDMDEDEDDDDEDDDDDDHHRCSYQQQTDICGFLNGSEKNDPYPLVSLRISQNMRCYGCLFWGQTGFSTLRLGVIWWLVHHQNFGYDLCMMVGQL